MQKLIKPFQKIRIIESPKQTKPGSIGYVESLHEIGTYNVLELRAIFTRFGKNGKERLSQSQIKVPLLGIDDMDISKESKSILKRLALRIGRGRMGDSEVEIIQENSKDLTCLPTWDFIAYISAISIFISSHMMRGNNREDVELKPCNIGYVLTNSFAYKNTELLEQQIKYFSNIDNRKMWLKMLMKEVSRSRQSIITRRAAITHRYESDYRILREAARDNGISIRRFSRGDIS